MRVGIVGAGISGLSAIKSCLEEGLQPVCFEKGDKLAGVWRLDAETPRASYSSLSCNVSKDMMALSDLPFPDDVCHFPSRQDVQEYVEKYAQTFGLEQYIVYGAEVVRITAGARTAWTMVTMHGTTRQEHDVDFIIASSGLFNCPRVPQYPGGEVYEGHVMHSMAYHDSVVLQDKRVLVVGFGNSGRDIAIDACKVSRGTVYWSIRGGGWISPFYHNGKPYDHISRLFMGMSDAFKRWVRSYLYAHVFYMPRSAAASPPPSPTTAAPGPAAASPPPSPTTAAPGPAAASPPPSTSGAGGRSTSPPPLDLARARFVPSDTLRGHLQRGDIQEVCEIEELTRTGVRLTDGTCLEVDVIVFATGYQRRFSYFDEVLEVEEQQAPLLYRHVFHPNLPGVAFPLTLYLTEAAPPVAEMQNRWAAAVFAGRASLPSSEDMRTWAVHYHRESYRRGRSDPLKESDRTRYLDFIADQIGVLPSWPSLLLHPRRLLAWYLSPSSSFQYRLHGPARWEGALAQCERTGPLAVRVRRAAQLTAFCVLSWRFGLWRSSISVLLYLVSGLLQLVKKARRPT